MMRALFLSLLFVSTLSAAEGPIKVGLLTVHPGHEGWGMINVPKTNVAEAQVQIPVFVANGVKPGPVLALIAGTHGSEYAPIMALQRVMPQIDPQRMSGAVIFVLVANPPMFWGRHVYYGPDGKNLNRMYPGDPKGTVSERIAYSITTEVIDKATHVVDMHCGDGNESLRPYTYWMLGGDEKIDQASREMALAFGLDHIVIDKERPKDPKKTVYTSTTAIVRGKPSITTESGGMGQTDEPSIAANVAGAWSLMAHLGIVEAPSVKVANPVFYSRTEVLRVPIAMVGYWQPVLDKRETVAEGTLIGRLFDISGILRHEIRAPFAGELMYVVSTPPVSEGEPLAMVAAP